LDKAGKNYLFRIGKLIGPQVEMYQEKKRQSPVELEFPHQYKRKIEVEIPNGYEVKGLESLDFSIKPDRSMGFTSTYSMRGNRLVVEVTEYYKEVRYPLEKFEDFRKVINAAADFNKIVLVLEKA